MRAWQAGVAQWLCEAYGPEPLGDMMNATIQYLENTDRFPSGLVEQIKAGHQYNGRVVPLGDAAWYPTLHFGMGATSVLAGADALGLMLVKRPDDVETALPAWENKPRPVITDFQQPTYPMRAIFTRTLVKEQRRQGISAAMHRFMFKFPVLMSLMLRFKHFRLRDSDLATDLV